MRYFTLLLSILLLSQCNNPPASEEISEETTDEISGQEWERADPMDYGFDSAELDETLNYIIDSTNATGIFLVIDGKHVLNYGDVEELSYLASCRKSILAILYGKYVEDGTIDLSRTMEEMGIDDRQGLLDIEKQATIDHLITARSGVYHPASNGGDNSADAPERGSQTPGEYFLYNNWDFNAAGYVFEKLTGKNIYDEIEAQLAIPLGFQDWDREAQRKTGDLDRSQFPAYHVWLSTRDMAKIGQLMLNKGKWGDQQVISEEWAEKIVSVVTPVDEMNPEYMRDQYFGYGYMWWVWDGPRVPEFLDGAYVARGAWGQYVVVVPSKNMVLAYKTKSEYRRRSDWNMFMGTLTRLLKYQD